MKFLVLEVCLTVLFFLIARFTGAVAKQLHSEYEFDAARMAARFAGFCSSAFLLGFVVSAFHGLILLARWVFA